MTWPLKGHPVCRCRSKAPNRLPSSQDYGHYSTDIYYARLDLLGQYGQARAASAEVAKSWSAAGDVNCKLLKWGLRAVF